MIREIEDLCDFFFEISNEDRLSILYLLKESPMKLTNLAKKLDITNQECSRHLQRLTDANLINKNQEGDYEITSYGYSSLILQKNQRFLTDHHDYFKDHSMKTLPTKFLSRIGELNDSQLNDDPLIAVHDMEEIMEQAEEYIYSIVDQYPANIYQLSEEAWKRNVKIKTLQYKNWEPPQQFLDECDETSDAFENARRKGLLVERTLNEIPVILFGSEKAVVIYFPKIDGDFDYQGFTSNEERSKKWCVDLFEYYWTVSTLKLSH
jgi:predicted transcriptional regulator